MPGYPQTDGRTAGGTWRKAGPFLFPLESRNEGHCSNTGADYWTSVDSAEAERRLISS